MSGAGVLIDLDGQRFGKLVVLGRGRKDAKRTYWKCQCDCGSAPKDVNGHSLRHSVTTSCGCARVRAPVSDEARAKLSRSAKVRHARGTAQEPVLLLPALPDERCEWRAGGKYGWESALDGQCTNLPAWRGGDWCADHLASQCREARAFHATLKTTVRCARPRCRWQATVPANESATTYAAHVASSHGTMS